MTDYFVSGKYHPKTVRLQAVSFQAGYDNKIAYKQDKIRAGITDNKGKVRYAKFTKNIQMDTNYNPNHLSSRYSHHTTGESSIGTA